MCFILKLGNSSELQQRLCNKVDSVPRVLRQAREMVRGSMSSWDHTGLRPWETAAANVYITENKRQCRCQASGNLKGAVDTAWGKSSWASENPKAKKMHTLLDNELEIDGVDKPCLTLATAQTLEQRQAAQWEDKTDENCYLLRAYYIQDTEYKSS